MKITKLLSFTLLAIMLMSAVSYGQSIPSGTARYEALGFNPFIKDASIDINRNPAWTTQYRNYAFGDIGRDVVNEFQLKEQFAAVNFGISKEIALGMVLNKYEDRWNDMDTSMISGYGINRPVVPFKLTFGWQASPNLALGLAPYFTSWSKETSDSNITKLNSIVFGGTIGLFSDLKGGWVEGAVDLKFHKYKKDATISNSQTVNENNGGLSLGVFARGFFNVNKQMDLNLVPYVEFSMFNWDPRQTVPTLAGDDKSYKNMSFGGGLGINMPIFDKGLLAGGISLGYVSTKNEQPSANNTHTITNFIFPAFNLGLEWPFTEWLTGRLGYQRAVGSEKDETIKTKTTYTTSTFVTDADHTITAGLGFHFNRFSIDGVIGEKFLKEGVYIVSGRPNNLFGMLSASYYFGK